MNSMSREELIRFIKKNEPHPLHDSARSSTLKDFIEAHDGASFSDLLFRYIRESGMSEVSVYKVAGITAQHFSKIRSDRNYRPTKETALALAVALHLDLPKTKELLRAGGYAFTHASKADIIVEYFIINEKWSLFEINEALDSYNLKPLGC